MLPRDQDQFVMSFHHTDLKNIVQFFDTYGVVVIRNVINKQQIEASINAIWNQDELTSRGVQRNNQFTWDRCWPKDGQIEKKGWISNNDTLFCPMAWCNRFNENIVTVFKALWAHKLRNVSPKLCVKPDRYSVMRPVIKPDWKTDENWLHTDQNPRLEHEFVRLQGILTFTDSSPTGGGGFLCIPGFQNDWKEYCKRNPIDEDVAPLPVETYDTYARRQEKIYARAGSLIIWDSRLPHANFPNTSKTQFRFAQYITFYPAHYDNEKRRRIKAEDASAVINYLKNNYNLEFNPEQMKMMGQ